VPVPIVRFLTPAAPPNAGPPASGYAGLDAFDDEFRTKLPPPPPPPGGGAASPYAYTPRYASGNGNLETTARAAVNDPQMLNPAMTPKVIVTGGSMATEAVRKAVAAAGTQAATIAIVQGVGGDFYDHDTYPNITGFHISVQKTCVDQLHLIPAGETVSILYDGTDNTSVPVYKYLRANTDRKTLRLWSLDQLQDDPTRIDGTTFMLIPNADFYNNRATIVGLVEGRFNTAGTNVYAIYPEREYKDLHGKGSQVRITVHGHDVTQTYRAAARLTGAIWRGEVGIGLPLPAKPLPQMVEGKTDP
jgi:hypothetical protein